MGKNKEKKQFQLTDKKSCIIYLYKIITSSEICIDTLKRYNIETEKTLKKYKCENCKFRLLCNNEID